MHRSHFGRSNMLKLVAARLKGLAPVPRDPSHSRLTAQVDLGYMYDCAPPKQVVSGLGAHSAPRHLARRTEKNRHRDQLPESPKCSFLEAAERAAISTPSSRVSRARLPP